MGNSTSSLLVVEDDGLIRMDLVDILADMGFDVLDSPNADHALTVMNSNGSISALLTDIDMPGSMDGLGLAKMTAEMWPERKIVVISGRYNLENGTLPEGARFLTKPISEKDLVATLRDLDVVA